MSSYLTGDFILLEPSRRAIRDHYRAKFFNGLGIPALKDPFAYSPPGDKQLGVVIGLLNKAISLHMGDPSALNTLKALVESSALGISAAGTELTGRPKLEHVNARAMGTMFFTKLWGN